MDKKSIGIITMHRVVNYGSALQAWALQRVLQRAGHEVQLIDYVFPTKAFRKKNKIPRWLRVARFCLHLLQGFPQKKKRQMFEEFWSQNYCLTKSYFTHEELTTNPPQFDCYMAGSDQIWNPKNILRDSSFLLDFVPKGKRKVSYASSLAVAAVSEECAELLRKNLSDFDSIGVREQNGAKLLEKILHREIKVCLDPTLLLQREDYEPLISQSKLNIDEPFILVYVLKYALNPYPYISRLIEAAQRQFNLPIVCLDFSSREHLHCKNVRNFHDVASPSDFLWLIAHATLVITTSFHGTVFSVNFGTPVYSIYDKSKGDDRIKSFMEMAGMGNHALYVGEPCSEFDAQPIAPKKLEELRKESLAFLQESIKQ